ncbi:GDNF family receptor alpha-2 isoform X2 [Thamnophis elegans]|uniref:GDNF family receptor alpha-2 isoform X2 n=1 Tax=Thamnophis elegans TaxID=35005 RepID=UPI001377501A|nr:GDNF family receptor alpha-2 isoform X2 [Thamnophis elegans]
MARAGLLRLLLALGRVLQAWAELPPPATLDGHGWQSPMDCTHANELCAAEPGCSSSFRTLRQCLAGRDHNTLLGNKECRLALEVLQGSALHGCRCRRRMKKELSCLQIYWSLHLGLAGGEEFYEVSPYEPIHSPLSDASRLASIVSGTDSAATSRSNPCLDAAKACNLNNNCRKLRSAYISTCNKEVSATELCSRRKCRKALRHFFDRVPSTYSYRLLFCPCKNQACAERRRQTIVPDCSYQEREKPNCLALRSQCRADTFCRSRLADFHTNCQAFLTSCSRDSYRACLDSYTGLIGLDLTPNYVDESFSNPVLSLWCSCQGSGNMEEECEKFLKDFTENACLRNAIQAFGNGTDLTSSPKALPQPLLTMPPSVGRTSSLPYSVNDSSLVDNTSMSITCISTEESGARVNQSKEQDLCFSKKSLTTALMPEQQRTLMDSKGSGNQLSFTGTISALLVFLVNMAM